MMKHRSTGFTIVELLIVIVVIGILAAITIVAFNGVQQRARYANLQQDVKSLQKAVELYYADNGTYPETGTGFGNTTNLTTIVGLTPTYIARTPTFPSGVAGYYAYIRNSSGDQYKIVRLVNTASELPAAEQSDPRPDTTRPGRGWGVWSSGGSSL